jgi:hypothetical protein
MGSRVILSSRGNFSAHLLLRETSEAAEQLKMNGFATNSIPLSTAAVIVFSHLPMQFTDDLFIRSTTHPFSKPSTEILSIIIIYSFCHLKTV